MDIHTRQLRYFMELAKCLNFTKAAINLYIAQPALSQQIAELERQFGVTLFIRTSRSVTLTPAGKVLRDSCAELLNGIDDLGERLLLAQSGVHGELKIGYLSVPFTNKLSLLVQRFKEKYPEVALEFCQRTLKELRAALDRNVIDVAFLYLYPTDLIHDASSTICLGEEDICLVIHEHHPFVQSGKNDYSLLRQETFFMVDEKTAPSWSLPFRDACSKMGIISMNKKEEVQLENILLQVEAGLGVSILPASLANFGLPHVRFIPIQKSRIALGAMWKPDNANASLPLFLEELSLLQNTD